jgi:hypothetical protein
MEDNPSKRVARKRPQLKPGIREDEWSIGKPVVNNKAPTSCLKMTNSLIYIAVAIGYRSHRMQASTICLLLCQLDRPINSLSVKMVPAARLDPYLAFTVPPEYTLLSL